VATIEANEVAGHQIFSGTYCRLFALELEIDGADIKANEFWKALGRSGPPTRRIHSTCGSRNGSTDYHIHLGWSAKDDCIKGSVEFAKNYRKPEPEESEPFAEDFVSWFSQFVLRSEMRIGCYCDFEYPADSGRKIKFLPLKLPFQGVTAEVDGVSFRIVPPKHGVEKIWATQGEQGLSVHLHAERVIDFSHFDPRREIAEISAGLDSIFDTGTENVKGGIQ